MSIENKTQLKSYFEKGDKPTQAQFENLIDSFRHIEDGATLVSLTKNEEENFVLEFSNGQKVAIQKTETSRSLADRFIEDTVIEEGYVRYKNNQGDVITQISVDHFVDKISASSFFKTAVENAIPSSHSIAYILGLQDALDQRVTIAQLNEAIAASAYGIKYSWANGDERIAQTGMSESEQGIQQDTREVYRYDGSSWVLFYTLDATHNHDDRYYSKTESDAKFVTEKREVSDLLTSTSTVIAASSKAIKTVNDKINNKLDKNEKANDSDKLDGLDSSAFVRKDADGNNTFNGQYLIFNHTNSSNVDAISFNDSTNDFLFNADRSKVNTSANAGVYASRFCLTDKNTKLAKGSGDSLKITTPSGYLDFGPKNTGHCHFYTDRSNFYFNKMLNVDTGIIRSYNEDLNLNRAGSSSARMIIANGVTYSDQTIGFRNGGRIRRYSHVGGFLEGSYNSVGNNSTKTNPIYTIGSSYVPADSSLGNMYGIGFSHGAASFLNSSDLGVNPPSSWGLYVAADGNARVFLNATHGHGYFRGHIYANQGIFRGNIVASSDKRLKRNIHKIQNALDKILKINGCTWERKDNGERQTGLIAQELQKVLPEAVHGDVTEKSHLGIAYGNVVGLLVEGIKEQTMKINDLKKTINDQAKESKILKEKLDTLLIPKN